MRTLAILILLAAPGSGAAQANRPFTGLFVGLDVGTQNIIGGSHVSGTDVLQQARRAVVSLSVGGRYQASWGTVIGFDLGLGLTNGNLQRRDASPPLEVDYRNRRQRHWNATLGQVVGGPSGTLVYGYLSEITRRFDVTVREGSSTYAQRDEQGLLRFGAGVERSIGGPISMRASLGSSRADFGSQRTNITPRRLLDGSLGLVWSPHE